MLCSMCCGCDFRVTECGETASEREGSETVFARSKSCYFLCFVQSLVSPFAIHFVITLSDRWPVDFFFLLILPLLLPTVALRCRCCCCWRTPLVTSIEHLILFLYSIPYFFFVFVQFLYNSLCICCMLCVCVWNGI